MNPMNLAFALNGTIFFSIVAIFVIIDGNHATKCVMITGLLFGAISQFLAQDDTEGVRAVAYFLSITGMAIGICACLMFAFS